MIMENETWKEIVGYEGRYEVSTLGRIKCLKRPGRRPEHIRRQSVSNCGYSMIALSKNSVSKLCTVHRVVAIAFLPNPEERKQVNHIDCVKTNNALSNLEWCTASDNMKHAAKNGLIKMSDEKRAFVVSLSNKVTRKKIIIHDTVEKTFKMYPSIISACRELGMHNARVSTCLKNGRLVMGRYKPILPERQVMAEIMMEGILSGEITIESNAKP